MKDVKPRPFRRSMRTKPRVAALPGSRAHLAECGQTALSAVRRGDARHLHRGSRRSSTWSENRDRPFALWVSFMEPHSPFDFPVEDRDRFDRGAFRRAAHRSRGRAGRFRMIFRDLPTTEKRGIIAAYYTSVAFLDRNIGRVLDALAPPRSGRRHVRRLYGGPRLRSGSSWPLREALRLRSGDARSADHALSRDRFGSGVVRDLTEHVDVPATIVDMMDLDPLPDHARPSPAALSGRPAAWMRRAITSSASIWRTKRHTSARARVEVHLLFRQARAHRRLRDRRIPRPAAIAASIDLKNRSRRVHRRCGAESGRRGHASKR